VPPAKPAQHDADVRVWILEDHEPFRRSVRRLLSNARGIVVEQDFATAETMLEFLDGQAAPPPDVLLLDLGLPGSHGLEVIRGFRDHHPGCRVLVLTVFEDVEKISGALTTGACGYLLKSALPREIVAAVREAHEGGVPMSPRVAQRLGISFHTVDGYARSLFEKLGVHSRAAAVARAMRDRLVSVSPSDGG